MGQIHHQDSQQTVNIACSKMTIGASGWLGRWSTQLDLRLMSLSPTVRVQITFFFFFNDKKDIKGVRWDGRERLGLNKVRWPSKQGDF